MPAICHIEAVTFLNKNLAEYPAGKFFIFRGVVLRVGILCPGRIAQELLSIGNKRDKYFSK